MQLSTVSKFLGKEANSLLEINFKTLPLNLEINLQKNIYIVCIHSNLNVDILKPQR